MKTLNISTLLKLAALAAALWLPARAGATATLTAGGSPATRLAAAYEKAGSAPAKSLLLPARPPAGVADAVEKTLRGPALAGADLKVKSEEEAPRAKRVSRLQEPGDAMGGGKERKEAAAKKAASGDRE